MSYDLEARPLAPRTLSPHDLAAQACAFATDVVVARVADRGLAADGAGFSLEPTPRGGAFLSAPAGRGPGDERLMEVVAMLAAGDGGTVIDRHTGRAWPAALLCEWLRAGALLSGRALAVNEERLARRGETSASRGFAARVDALARHVAAPAAGASEALRARLHEELSYYAARPALVWAAARGLALVGDFSRLEALARAPQKDSDPDAFAVAAAYGAAAVPFFARVLGDPDPNFRRAAARVLHQIHSPEVLPLVARALEDKRSTVREAVLEADFGRILELPGGRAALAPVLSRLASDPSSMVRKLRSRWVEG